MARKPKKAQPAKDAPKGKGRKPQNEAPAQAVSDKKPHGRPTLYTEEIASEILDRLSLGETLRMICDNDPRMPSRITVMRWADEDREGFSDRYRASRERQRDTWADDIVDISDDGRNDYVEKKMANGETKEVFSRDHVERSKLRVATRQWLMKVGSPTKYGDKVENTHKADAAFVAIWSAMGGGSSKKAS